MTRRKAFIIAVCVIAVAFALIGGITAYIGRVTTANSAAITETTQGGENSSIYPISPRRAALIALTATPGASLVEAPNVVSFQGVDAYEVQLDGGIVYV